MALTRQVVTTSNAGTDATRPTVPACNHPGRILVSGNPLTVEANSFAARMNRREQAVSSPKESA